MHTAYAQEIYKNHHLWTTAIGDVNLSQKVAFNSETHVRFTNKYRDLQQYLFIPGIKYKWKKEAELMVGYTFFKNYPYRLSPIPMPMKEHTLWQQITLNQKVGKFSAFHRFRMEQRFTDRVLWANDKDPFIQGRNYNNRFRYRILLNRPIAFKEKLYVMTFNELWFNLSPSSVPMSLNQNLFYLGSYYKVHQNVKLGVGFMHQTLSKGNGIYEQNTMLSLLCLYSFSPFRKGGE